MSTTAHGNWTGQIKAAITVTDANGKIIEMNPGSIEVFKADGGAKLIGSDIFACHQEPSRTKLRTMYHEQKPNHYTITKNGQRKIIHQVPLFQDGKFAGFVEISLQIPEKMPHFNRD